MSPQPWLRRRCVVGGAIIAATLPLAVVLAPNASALSNRRVCGSQWGPKNTEYLTEIKQIRKDDDCDYDREHFDETSPINTMTCEELSTLVMWSTFAAGVPKPKEYDPKDICKSFPVDGYFSITWSKEVLAWGNF